MSPDTLKLRQMLGVIVAMLTFTVSLSAAEPETSKFTVLLAPREGEVAPLSITAANVEASIGAHRYKVREIRPRGQGTGRTVIVLDFAATSPTNHACLIAEAWAAMRRVQDTPPPTVIATGNSRFMQFISFGKGGALQVYGGDDLGAIEQTCAAGGARERFSIVSILRSGGSIATFTSLISGFDSSEAPVRVFWVSDSFRQFDKRPAISCPLGENVFPCQSNPPNVAYRLLGQISKAGVSVFPIVLGDHHHGQLRLPSKYDMKAAEYMARYLGGFATAVSGAPGQTLFRVLQTTGKGLLLSLEGPVSDRRSPDKQNVLSISIMGSKPELHWSRPFSVSREDHMQYPDMLAATRLVWPGEGLRLEFGCSLQRDPAEASLRLIVPRGVMTASSGKVDVYFSYLNESGFTKQRWTFERPSDGSGSLCVPMIHARNGTEFQVVVSDRVSSWVGARKGVLVPHQSGRKIDVVTKAITGKDTK